MFESITDPKIYEIFFNSWFFINLFVKIALVTVFGKSSGLARWKLPIITLLMYFIAYIFAGFVFWLQTNFTTFNVGNNIRAYIFFPVALLLLSKLFKYKTLDLCDFFAPWICFRNGLGKIACVVSGCCYGYPCEFGFYNRVTGTTLFPIQLVEVICSLLIFAFLLFVIRCKKTRRGELYPIMLIVFGIFRFYLEFGKDSKKLFLGLGELSLHSLFMVLVGMVWLYILKRYYEKTAPHRSKKAHRKKA